MGSCKLREFESRFYKSLLSALNKNRSEANALWAIFTSPEVLASLDGIEYDENGEPTFESVSRAIGGFSQYSNDSISANGAAMEAGFQDSNGNLKVYESDKEAFMDAIDFNTKNKDKVAIPIKSEEGTTIKVDMKTFENSTKPQELVFQNALNNQLLSIMRRAGFNAETVEGTAHSVFDPSNATVTADGLRTVIRIAQGTEGEAAFPEEFAHFIIEALGTNNLVVRLMDTISSDIAERILGDEFERYNEKYKGDDLRLRKEAAGKLLSSYITGEKLDIKQPTSLLSRIWNFVKFMFGQISEDDIQSAFIEASKQAESLASFVTTEDVVPLIDSNMIFDTAPLYHLADEVSKDQKMLEKAIQLATKRLNIISSRVGMSVNKGEYKIMKDLNSYLKHKNYANGCIFFLKASMSQINDLNTQLESLRTSDIRDDSDLSKLRKVATTLRTIKEFSDGYTPIIKDLMRAGYAQRAGELEMEEEDADNIAEKASELFSIINNINSTYADLRYNAVYNLLKVYWGEDKVMKFGKDKGSTVTLEMILDHADHDLNTIDKLISSLSDANDPLLSLIDKVVKNSQSNRDKLIEETVRDIKGAYKQLTAAGENTDFMYERDSNGKLTGRYISEYDFDRFNRERAAFVETLEEKEMPGYKIHQLIERWEKEHTTEISIGHRTERVPIYKTNALDNLTTAQRDFYDLMIKAKGALDGMLPARTTTLYNAIQMRDDMLDNVMNNISDPKKAVKVAWSNFKDKFIRRTDDTEYGEIKDVTLDFAGKEVKGIPVFYTRKLEDVDRLSTDFLTSMIAYTGMAVNYFEMSKIVDILELTRELVNERDVKQMAGDRQLFEKVKMFGREYTQAYTKKGKDTNIGKRLEDYFDMVLYNRMKKHEVLHIGSHEIDLGKLADLISSWTGIVDLGFNPFSAISNITMGKMQQFFESWGNEYFGKKNLIKAEGVYYKDLVPYLGEVNGVVKTSKMHLLVERFDALEEFYSSLTNTKYKKGALSRIIGNGNWYILNNLGEHQLHITTLYAMLDHIKVKKGGQEMSLLDAYTTENIVDDNGRILGAKLKLEGVTLLDGTEITDEFLEALKQKTKKVNQAMNGAFNETDKGTIHQYSYGRLAMKFKQWMPAHYARRYASQHYDAAMDTYREGFYRTFIRFNWGLMQDLRKGQFELATQWNNLSNEEKANIRRALSEIAIWGVLSLSILLMGKASDHKGKWAKRMLLYNLNRMKMEAGASTPNVNMVSEMLKLFKSPMASVDVVDNILNLFEFQNMFVELESGRYKGMSKWRRDLLKTLPVYGQVNKVIDIGNEDYMFKLFN